MKTIEKLKECAQKLLSKAKGCHDWDHTERVYNTCLHLGKKEGAKMEVLETAAILHDIGREYQDQNKGRICHAEKGAEMAKELLPKFIKDQAKITKIIHCIETHRFRGANIPKSKEAKILFDADKLDAIGAVGIGRAFLFSGEIGAKLHHNHSVDISQTKLYSQDDTAYREYLVELRHIKEKMLTKEVRKMAKERHDFMVEFFKRLNKEVAGEL